MLNLISYSSALLISHYCYCTGKLYYNIIIDFCFSYSIELRRFKLKNKLFKLIDLDSDIDKIIKTFSEYYILAFRLRAAV